MQWVLRSRGPGERFLAEILDRNTVHVWCLDSARLSDHEVASAAMLLSPEQRARQQHFHFQEDRRDFASAHALLRHSLSLYSDISPEAWRFRVAANGKPSLLRDRNQKGNSFGFSLSHTRGLVACAIGTRLVVGVDVERVDRTVDIDSIAPLCLSPSELDALMRCPAPERQARFIELWVLKEAFVKATGKGLSDLKESSFTLRDDGGFRLISPSNNVGGWHFELFRPTDQYRLAVAVYSSSVKVIAQWTDLRSYINARTTSNRTVPPT